MFHPSVTQTSEKERNKNISQGEFVDMAVLDVGKLKKPL